MIGAWLARTAAAVSFEDASERLDGAVNESALAGGSGYAGVALLDHDGDGDLDVYLSNGPDRSGTLLANDGTGWFEDVAAAAGADVTSGTRGILAADYDGDGDADLVMAGDLAAPMRLLANDGDGTFTDATAASGVDGARRNISPHAADVDGDGWLDLYVTAGATTELHWPNTLWRNQGDGTFVEDAAAAGVATERGACAATFLHADADDAIDLLVGNCSDMGGPHLPFEVYRNRGDGTFEDVYDSAGAWALGHWMGFAVADFDGDGWLDFFATNSGVLREQPHALYRNDRDGSFTDVAVEAGVADWEFGWGTVAADFDADGDEDLYFTGKSHAADHYASPGDLFLNRGDGTFEAPIVPLDLSEAYTSGVAAGDLDGDGFVDLLIATTAFPPGDLDGRLVFLRNLGTDHRWLQARLVGAGPNRDAVGARIRATTPDGRRQLRELAAGSSYQSTSSPWPTFGLADHAEARVCVRWPDGTGEDFGTFAADQRVDLVQGAGLAPDPCGPDAELPPGSDPDPTDPGCGCAGRGGGPGAFAAPRALGATVLVLLGLRRRR